MPLETAIKSKSPPPQSLWPGRFFFFLIPLILIGLLLIGYFFLKPGLNNQNKKVTQDTQTIIKTDQITFAQPEDKTRFEELLKASASEKDPAKKAQSLGIAYISISSEYNRLPTSEKHQALVDLFNYIEKNFPDQIKKLALTVPCKETSCGAKEVYSTDLEVLKSNIKKLKLGDQYQELILINLRDAAITHGKNDKELEYTSISGLFFNLRTVWEATKDLSVKETIAQVLAYLEKVDPSHYQIDQKYKVLTLK